MLQNPEFLLLTPLILYSLHIILKKQGYSRKIGLSRALIVSLLLLAVSSPTITQEASSNTQEKINILVDNTSSMNAVENPELDIGGEKTVFIRANSSNIFSQAAQSIEQDSQNLLVTDGQTTEPSSDLVKAANRKNASISIHRLNGKKESAITIQGPSTTVPEAENRFTVKTSSAREEPVTINITLDGEKIYNGPTNKSYTFTRKFSSEGEHIIKAEIEGKDSIQRNNQYYKTVKVREKPEILSIGSPGSLEDNLNQFYDIENRDQLPEELDKYYSIIAKKPVENNNLQTYLAQGNGLMYTGSLKDKIPSYLPLKQSENDDGNSGAKVIILIDISEATGGECVRGTEEFCIDRSSSGGISKESIQIAYSLVDSLKKNNKVGVVAYSGDSYLVSEPKTLAYNRESIKEKISRIKPQGPSFHDLGIKGASELTEKNDTVVMLSDGNIGTYNRQDIDGKTRRQAESLEGKLITIGMGEEPNKPLLQDIAETTDGYYLENREAGRLNFRFGSGGGETQYTPIAVVNPNHFITRGLELNGDATDFEKVDAKRTGKKLVASSEGQEVLSAWRYGLGRVAAFSAGNQNLGRISDTDPTLVSKTASWTVGKPQRKRDQWKSVEDSAKPEKPEAKASYQIKGLTKRSEDLYTSKINVTEPGVHKWEGETYAYNYNPEVDEVGQDMDKLENIAQETGGMIYSQNNIEEISSEVDQTSRKVVKEISLMPYLLLLALIVFLGEVGYRKRKGRL
ncbi:VWA domain-containing protein [Candidatus Nanohalobium constans]|uniref:von Willebrand factor type A n=1 Tax=Candidatus Nanohalobium constans TaxID=2565781 RepID=A0A5Q0UFV4_9ARCH|nr:VWA domain-containing protein [Candidatus Nanohalobium constans]QGA80271.1 von Willebrand factor type A [Candidatus Nanohalobium constans]